MSQIEHTPGLWTARESRIYKGLYDIQAPVGRYGKMRIAEVYNGDIYAADTPVPIRRNAEDNARLMAAAPEMLEAALAVVDAYGCECVDQGRPSHCPMCVLRKAITKAVGIE